MKRFVLFFVLFIGFVFLFSCSKKIDFYDLFLMSENNTTTETNKAYKNAYKKLNKKEQEQFKVFAENLSIFDFYKIITEKHPDMFSNYNDFINTFNEIMETQDKERQQIIQKYQNNIRNLNNRKYIEIQRLWNNDINKAEKYYDTYCFSLSDISPLNKFEYKAANEKIKEIFSKMSYIEKKGLFYFIVIYTNEKKNEVKKEYYDFFEEIHERDKAIDIALEEERQKKAENARQIAKEKQEIIDKEKTRRGGVEHKLTLSDYSTRPGVSQGKNMRSFYLMKDGSGTFDSNFNIDKYINKENIAFGREAYLLNAIVSINGIKYIVID